MKKTNKILIIAIVIILIAAIIIFGYLFYTTEYFKSPQELFYKYLEQDFIQISSQFEDVKETEYEKFLDSNSYTHSIEITPSYIENLNTTSPSNDNDINYMKMQISGQVNRQDDYMDYNFKILKDDEDQEEMSLVVNKVDDVLDYGVKFSILDDYIGFEDKSVDSILSQIGFGSSIGSNLDLINQKKNLYWVSSDKEQLFKSFEDIAVSYLKEATFEKTKDKVITVDSKPYTTNEYKVTVNQEQYNRMIIAMLKQIKNDDLIKDKIYYINQILQLSGITPESFVIDFASTVDISYIPNINEDNSLHEYISKQIDDLISTIENNNSSSKDVTISIYENMKKPIRVLIDLPFKSFTLDTVDYEENQLIEFNYKLKETIKENYIKVKRSVKQDQTILEITKQQDENQTVIRNIKNLEISDGNLNKTNEFSYTYNKNCLKLMIEENKKAVTSTQIQKQELTNRNYICLNKLTDDELESFKDDYYDIFIDFKNDFNQKIDTQNLVNVLKGINLVDESVQIDPYTNLTQTEVSRFNSNFELYFSSKTKPDFVLKLIDLIEPNLAAFEVSDSKTLKFTLEQNNENKTLADKSRQIIEDPQNSSYVYDIWGSYNDTTGIIEEIYVRINDKKN